MNLKINRSFEKIILFPLFLSVSFSICYWAIAKYDVYSDYRACGDAYSYIKMSRMEYKDVPRPYRYRILMPSIVYLLNKNLKIEGFLSKYYEDVDKKTIQLNFGIINILAITFTAFLLYYYCLHLAFTKWESLVGAFLYFTSFFVVTYYSVPMVDSLASFFVMACFYSILKNKSLGLFFAFLLGVFTKESTFFIILLIILVDRNIFSKRLFACLPGVFAYILFVRIFPAGEGENIFSIALNVNTLKQYLQSYTQSLNFYTVIEYIQTFMFLWALFFYALYKVKKPVFLKRSLWLMLFPFFVSPVVGASAVGRVAFYLFPIVIPLSLLALRDFLGVDAGVKSDMLR